MRWTSVCTAFSILLFLNSPYLISFILTLLLYIAACERSVPDPWSYPPHPHLRLRWEYNTLMMEEDLDNNWLISLEGVQGMLVKKSGGVIVLSSSSLPISFHSSIIGATNYGRLQQSQFRGTLTSRWTVQSSVASHWWYPRICVGVGVTPAPAHCEFITVTKPMELVH